MQPVHRFLRAVFLLVLVLACHAVPLKVAGAFTLSSGVETVSHASVGTAWQTLTFENTYTNPVVVCVYTLPSSAAPPATVRVRNVGATSVEVRMQQFGPGTTVTASTVNCLVAETGLHTLPDGGLIEARTVLSNSTHGQVAVDGWLIAPMQNMSGSFAGAFSSPIALGQVMTFNDADASAFFANDCDDRRNPAFLSGFADGICVGKHIGQVSGSRADETLGVIVVEAGTGSYTGIAYNAGAGAATIRGVGNAPPYSYGLGSGFEFAVATINGMRGAQGGWAVMYGANPLAGSSVTLAIDEETISGDVSRAHTNERVDFFAIRRLPVTAVSKSVDWAEIAETLTLNYEITLENTGELNQTAVVVTDTLPDASTGAVSGPVESGGSVAGVFEPGEIWTYTVSYNVVPADVFTGNTLVNSVAVTSSEYTAEGLADEQASAVTSVVAPAPGMSVSKTADQLLEVPAGQVVTYTYVVANTGNQTITDVSLNDAHGGSGPAPSPSNETLTSDTMVTGDSTDSVANDGVWDKLAQGDSITLTATYTVTQQDVDLLQ